MFGSDHKSPRYFITVFKINSRQKIVRVSLKIVLAETGFFKCNLLVILKVDFKIDIQGRW